MHTLSWASHFALNVNDTVRFHEYYSWHQDSGYILVTAVDSMLIDGTYRKRIHLQGGYSVNMMGIETQDWIAGIGSTTGIIPQFTGFEQFIDLNCYFQNGTLVHNFYGGPCSLILSSTAQTSTEQVRFTHNNHELQFTNIDLSGFTICVYDLQGKKVMKQPLTENRISTSGLDNGVYFFQLSNASEMHSGRFIRIEN